MFLLFIGWVLMMLDKLSWGLWLFSCCMSILMNDQEHVSVYIPSIGND